MCVLRVCMLCVCGCVCVCVCVCVWYVVCCICIVCVCVCACVCVCVCICTNSNASHRNRALSQDNLWREEKGGPLGDRPRYLKKQPDLSKWNSIATISPVDSVYQAWDNRNRPGRSRQPPRPCLYHAENEWTSHIHHTSHSVSFSTVPPAAALETQITSPAHHRYQNRAEHCSTVSQTTAGPQKKTVVCQSSTQTLQKSSAACLSANPQQKGPDKISVGDSWKRDAQDKQQTADLLQQEVKQLQAKVQHSIEESERLRRLSLELQFQRRLEEFHQQNEDDESDSRADRTWFQTGSDVGGELLSVHWKSHMICCMHTAKKCFSSLDFCIFSSQNI